MIHSLFNLSSNDWLLVAFISIGCNILIAITGILPSAFVTIGTVGYFGFHTGLIILMIGEATGAIVSFILYRKGVNKLSSYPKIRQIENKFLEKIKTTDGITAFFMVILLRILPFVPSGAVTLTAALSKMKVISFSVASTLGKVPALWIEAYSINHVLQLPFESQLTVSLSVCIVVLLYFLLKRNTP